MTSFNKEVKGPVSLELRKVKNVTEFVAVDAHGAVQILPSRQQPVDLLLEEFAPIARLSS